MNTITGTATGYGEATNAPLDIFYYEVIDPSSRKNRLRYITTTTASTNGWTYIEFVELARKEKRRNRYNRMAKRRGLHK